MCVSDVAFVCSDMAWLCLLLSSVSCLCTYRFIFNEPAGCLSLMWLQVCLRKIQPVERTILKMWHWLTHKHIVNTHTHQIISASMNPWEEYRDESVSRGVLLIFPKVPVGLTYPEEACVVFPVGNTKWLSNLARPLSQLCFPITGLGIVQCMNK